jgi:hypothetical protein
MPKSTTAEGLARRFCLALAEETAGMPLGTWRIVDTLAQRMDVTFEEASAIADDCVRRRWANHQFHSIRIREAGRRVAVSVGKAIVSKRQPTAQAKATRKRRPRKSG